MPNPSPPSSASSSVERQYHVNGRAAVVASRERSSGTPRKEKQGPRESSALQDPGLKDYVRIPGSKDSFERERRRDVFRGGETMLEGRKS